MSFVSLQRWIYVSGDSVPNVLRALARTLDELTPNDVPEDEWIHDYSTSPIELSYSKFDQSDEPYRAGMCISWKEDKSEKPIEKDRYADEA